MRNCVRRGIAFVLGLSGLMGSGASTAYADWVPGEGMAASMAINILLGKEIEENSDLGFCDTCYMGAYIQPGQDSWFQMPLEAGVQYVLAGAVDKKCDLDILIEDGSGQRLAADAGSDNIPVVRFTPPATLVYKVRLKLFSGPGSRFCGIVLLKEGGWTLPVGNLGAAAGQMLQRCERVSSVVPARFLEVPGEWAVIGSVCRNGGTAGWRDMKFGSGRRVVVTGADSHSRDTDLRLTRDNGSGSEVDEDDESDNEPVLEFRSRSSDRYSLHIENARSSGATIIMTALLEVGN